MDRQLVPRGEGGIAQEAQKEAAKRAPYTLAGAGAGGILGALIAGPLGALIGTIFGSLVGYTRDTEQQKEV